MKRDDNLEEKNNGELMTGYFNACINGDEELKEAIAEELGERGWVKEGDPGDTSSWGNHRKE